MRLVLWLAAAFFYLVCFTVDRSTYYLLEISLFLVEQVYEDFDMGNFYCHALSHFTPLKVSVASAHLCLCVACTIAKFLKHTYQL